MRGIERTLSAGVAVPGVTAAAIKLAVSAVVGQLKEMAHDLREQERDRHMCRSR